MPIPGILSGSERIYKSVTLSGLNLTSTHPSPFSFLLSSLYSLHVFLSLSRDIAEGEALSYDYQFDTNVRQT
jgi:hypothetical protein